MLCPPCLGVPITYMSSTVVGGLLSTTTCQWGGEISDPVYLKIDLLCS